MFFVSSCAVKRFSLVFCFLVWAPWAHGVVIQNISFEGLNRFSRATVLHHLPLQKGMEASDDRMDQALQSLYRTGFFHNISLKIKGTTLHVLVVENKFFQAITFKGNRHISTKELQKIVGLRPGDLFSPSRVRECMNAIEALYQSKGYFTSSVSFVEKPRGSNGLEGTFVVQEGASNTIACIKFTGLTRFSPDTLKGLLQTKEDRWYYFFKKRYDPQRLEFDKEILHNYYASKGYADFQVCQVIKELSPDKTKLYLTFHLQEGPCYAMGKIEGKSDVQGLKEKISPWVQKLAIKNHSVFDGKKAQEACKLLTEQCKKEGWSFVTTTFETCKKNTSTGAMVMDIVFCVQPVVPSYINHIAIKGNTVTRDYVIRRQLEVREGDPFDVQKILRSQENVYFTGLFSDISITHFPSKEGENLVDVTFRVNERQTSSANLEGGWGSHEGFIGALVFSEKNFRGKEQDFFIKLERSQQTIYSFSLGMSDEHFLNTPVGAGLSVYDKLSVVEQPNGGSNALDGSKNTNTKDLQRRQTGFSLKTGYMLAPRLKQGWNYGFSREFVPSPTKIRTQKEGKKDGRSQREAFLSDPSIPHVPDELISQLEQARNTQSAYCIDDFGRFLSSSLEHSLSYDKRNNTLEPQKGFRVALSNEWAGLGGDAKYLSHTLSGQWYYHLSPRYDWVLSLKGQYSLMHHTKKIRYFDRHTLGGDSFLGFDHEGVSPRDSVTNQALGGRQLLSSSLNLSVPLVSFLGLKGVLFTKWGSVWDCGLKPSAQSPIQGDAFCMRGSVGAGVLWQGPMGFRVGVSFSKALRKQTFDKPCVFNVTMGREF